MKDIENKDYHAIVGASASVLKLMIEKTPAHVYAQYFDQSRKHRESSDAMKIGAAIHMAVLEPEKFAKTYAFLDADKRTKEGKSAHAEFEKLGMIALKPETYEMITNVAESVLSKQLAIRLLQDGHAEKSFIYDDAELGIALKIRPDYLIEPCDKWPNGLIVDLKTTEDASPSGFCRAIFSYNYALQAAWYVDVFQKHFGTYMPPPFVFLACEKEAPFECGFYEAEEFVIEYGRKQYQSVLPILAECIRTNIWNGYDDGLAELQFTPWQLKTMGVDFDDAEVSFV